MGGWAREVGDAGEASCVHRARPWLLPGWPRLLCSVAKENCRVEDPLLQGLDHGLHHTWLKARRLAIKGNRPPGRENDTGVTSL